MILSLTYLLCFRKLRTRDKIRTGRKVSQTKAKNGSDSGGPVKDNFSRQSEELMRVICSRGVMVRWGSQNRKVPDVKDLNLGVHQIAPWMGRSQVHLGDTLKEANSRWRVCPGLRHNLYPLSGNMIVHWISWGIPVQNSSKFWMKYS